MLCYVHAYVNFMQQTVPRILVIKKDIMYSFLNTHCFQKMIHFYNISFFLENELLESQSFYLISKL